MARLEITVDTGFSGAKHYDSVELPEDWDEMGEEERQQYIDDCCEEAVWNRISAYGEVVED